jgi:hypothetical protein
MYRDESKPPTCLACASTQVTPETKFDPTEGFARIHFDVARPKGRRLFAATQESFTVDRARVCLACGYVMYSLSPRTRQELERRMAELVAIPPRDD